MIFCIAVVLGETLGLRSLRRLGLGRLIPEFNKHSPNCCIIAAGGLRSSLLTCMTVVPARGLLAHWVKVPHTES